MNSIVEKINQLANAKLTLFNDAGETYPAGDITTLIHTNKGLTLRWAAPEPLNNALPFTYAALHRGKKIIQVTQIKPVDNGVYGTEFELRV